MHYGREENKYLKKLFRIGVEDMQANVGKDEKGRGKIKRVEKNNGEEYFARNFGLD